MNSEEFIDKINAAGILHNMGVINRKTNKYRDAIQSFEECLELYNECYTVYNKSSMTSSSPTSSPNITEYKTPKGITICLELKIAQTLQSCARLHSKSLHDTYAAIKAHEDTITFLLEGKLVSYYPSQQQNHLDQDGGVVNYYWCDDEGNYHNSVKDEDQNVTTFNNTSPNKVNTNYDMSTPPPSNTKSKNNKLVSFNLAGINVIKLSQHERVRLVTISLNALAKIYTIREESRRTSKKKSDDYQREHEIDDEHNNGDDNHIDSSEDPLRYHQTAINFLRQVPDYKSKTSIQALSNSYKTICTAQDRALSINTLTPSMIIDLRKDICSTLMQMGNLHMERGHVNLAIEVFEEARTIRDELYNGDIQHNEQIESIHALALAYEKIHDFDKAISCFQQILKFRRKSHGPESMEVANLYCTMSNMFRITKNLAESLSMIKHAIALYKKNKQCHDQFEDNNEESEKIMISILGALKNQGGLYMQMDEINMAISSFEEIMTLQGQMGLENHPDFADTMNILGDLYFTSNNLIKAKSYFSRSLGLYKQFGIGLNDPDLVMVLKSIEEIDLAMKKDLVIKERSRTDISPSPKQCSPNSREGHKNRKAHTTKTNPVQNNDLYTNMEIYTDANDSDEDDVVSTITFLTEKRPRRLTRRKKLWDPADLTYEGVITMTKNAIGSLAAVTEEFLSGVNDIADTKPTHISTSESETEVEDSSILRGDVLNQMNTDAVREENSYSMKKTSDMSIRSEDASTLFGTAFVGSQSIASQRLSTQDDASTLFGTSFVNTVMSEVKDQTTNGAQGKTLNQNGQISQSTPNFIKDIKSDDLLAHMNVVTNDMDDEDIAKPFKDIVGVDVSFDDTPDYSANKRKNFEKLSNCLDELDVLEDRYGSGHFKSLETLVTLSDIYVSNGDHSKAIVTLTKITEVQMKKYGGNHIELAKTYTKIAKLCHSKGEYKKAIENYVKVKDIENFLYGNSDPRIARTLNKLGLVELDREEFDMAMDYFQEALRIQRIYLAPNEINPDISQTLVNIGSVYYKERNSFGKIKQIEKTYKSFIESGMLGKIAFAHSERGEYVRAIHFYEELLQLNKNQGQSLHGTIATLNNLGTLNVKLGRYIEAMGHHEKALELMSTSSDFKETDKCDTKCLIGVVEYKSGNFNKAIEILESVQLYQKDNLGTDHPKLAKTMFHLGVINRLQYHYEEAMSKFHAAVEIQMNSLSTHHPDTMNTKMEIGISKLESFQLDEAYSDFKALLKSQRYVLGDIHPDIALTYHYMGLCCFKKDEITNAKQKLKQSFRMYKSLKVESPEKAALLDSIGLVHMRRGKLDKASTMFQDSLRIRGETLSEAHYEQSYALFNLGNVESEKRNFPEAIAYFKKSMNIAIRTFGMSHPFIGDIHRSLGQVQERKCQFNEARKEILLALDIYEKAELPDSHEKVVGAKNDLVRVQNDETLYV